jgi:hypothetical protein
MGSLVPILMNSLRARRLVLSRIIEGLNTNSVMAIFSVAMAKLGV